MTRILLIRHGSTQWNEAKLVQGHRDNPLNDRGWAQVAALVDLLKGTRYEAVYSSDLQRARQTAAPLAEARELVVELDSDLREIDEGACEGVPSLEVPRRWPQLAGSMKFVSRRPGGECPQEVLRRAVAAVARIVRQHSGEVVVVSHQFTLHCLLGFALDLEGVLLDQIRGLRPCEVVGVEGSVSTGSLNLGAPHTLAGGSPDLTITHDRQAT